MGTTETGCWNCGGPHQRKDCPNNDINDPMAIVPGYQGGQGQDRGYGQQDRGQGSSSFGRDRDQSSYAQQGKERRFNEERPRDEGYARRPDGDEREGDRKRHRSRSPRRERDRDGDRRRDDRERDRDRDRDRDRRDRRD